MLRESKRRRVCFVTGSRAEFGLTASTLRALRDHPAIELQIIATGMHLHASRGSTLREIRRDGWMVNATVPWREDASPSGTARAMGLATATLVGRLDQLEPDIVLVVGDRVEAFAAASAAHVSGRIVAHVHGGDRAMGLVDDSLRHAISKLAHIHFAATRQSGERLHAMGEDRWRIRVVGAPGVDDVRRQAASVRTIRAFAADLGIDRIDQSALLLLHPSEANDRLEAARTRQLISAAAANFGEPIIALLPNTDPGADGIAAALRQAAQRKQVRLVTHAERSVFLGLLRDCRALIGNSSAGIIEAGSFGTPVLDIGPRQRGRERGGNVLHSEWRVPNLTAAMARIARQRRRAVADNPYDRGGAAKKIVRVLASLALDERLQRKVIRY